MAWKPIPGTDGLYAASDRGQIKRIKGGQGTKGRNRVLTPTSNGKGYLKVRLSVNGKIKQRTVHALVMLTFVGPRPSNDHVVNHKNGKKTDNRLSNLEYVTYQGNNEHAHKVLKRHVARGEQKSTLTEDDVATIKRRVNAGESRAAIGREYGFSGVHIGRIVSGKSWAHT